MTSINNKLRACVHTFTCVCGTSVSYAHINLFEFVGTYCPSPHSTNHDVRNFEIIYMMPLWLPSLSFCQPSPCKRLPVLEFILQDQLQLHLRHFLGFFEYIKMPSQPWKGSWQRRKWTNKQNGGTEMVAEWGDRDVNKQIVEGQRWE